MGTAVHLDEGIAFDDSPFFSIPFRKPAGISPAEKFLFIIRIIGDDDAALRGVGAFEVGLCIFDFELLYEIECWYNGLPEQKEIKEAVKELNKKYKDNEDARLAMKAAKESVAALKEYQKAQCSFMKGKDAQGSKSMRKIQSKYPDTKYATMPEELVDVKLPLVAPAGSSSSSGKGG